MMRSALVLSQVQCALSRTRKVETVETLVKGLDSSALVFGIRFQNISVSVAPTLPSLDPAPPPAHPPALP